MKANFINRTHIEGRLYQHTLELKTSGPNSANPGTEYISGNIEIATDDNFFIFPTTLMILYSKIGCKITTFFAHTQVFLSISGNMIDKSIN